MSPLLQLIPQSCRTIHAPSNTAGRTAPDMTDGRQHSLDIRRAPVQAPANRRYGASRIAAVRLPSFSYCAASAATTIILDCGADSIECAAACEAISTALWQPPRAAGTA